MISLTLPLPPSVNALYRNARGKGRVKTKRYMEWLNSAGWHVKEQRPKPVAGRVYIQVLLQVPPGYVTKRADASNFVKALEDLLVEHRLIDDDSWQIVRGVHCDWIEERGRQCEVRVYSADAGRFEFLPKIQAAESEAA